ASGDMDVVIAGGVESMTRAPMFANIEGVSPSVQLTKRYEIVNQGISAEKIARKWGVSRQQLDEFSLASHRRALTASLAGVLGEGPAPVGVTGEHGNRRVFTTDEGPRESTPLRA